MFSLVVCLRLSVCLYVYVCVCVCVCVVFVGRKIGRGKIASQSERITENQSADSESSELKSLKDERRKGEGKCCEVLKKD